MRWIIVAMLVGCATTPVTAPTLPANCVGTWRPTAGTPVYHLDPAAIVAGMTAVAPCVRACLTEPGLWNVTVTIGQSGQLTNVHVLSPQTSGPIVDCIVATVSMASFPPSSGAPISLVYPFVAHQDDRRGASANRPPSRGAYLSRLTSPSMAPSVTASFSAAIASDTRPIGTATK
jgi:hypothetical protein